MLYFLIMTTMSFGKNNQSEKLNRYIKNLTGEDKKLSQIAADSLVAFGSRAVTLLIKNLSQVDEKKVPTVMDALIRIGEPARIAAENALTKKDTLLYNRIKEFFLIGKWIGSPIDNENCKITLHLKQTNSQEYEAILKIPNPLVKKEVMYEDTNLIELSFSGRMECDSLTLYLDLWGLDGKKLPAYMKLKLHGVDVLEGIGEGNPVAFYITSEGPDNMSWGIMSFKTDFLTPVNAIHEIKTIWFEFPFFTCNCFESKDKSWNPKLQKVNLIFKKRLSHN